MAKLKVRLRHYCNLPGSIGKPGDTVNVDEALAVEWEAHGACEVLGPARTRKAATTVAKEEKPETATDDEAEQATVKGLGKATVKTATTDQPEVER